MGGPDRVRVLFVAYGSAHIAKVAPVVAELERRGVECLVLALTLGYKQALRLGLRPIGYRDLMQLVEDPQEVIERGRALFDRNSHPDVDAYESACYLGVNYQDWVDDFGEEEAARRYREGGRRAFHPVRFMRKVLAHLRPDAVISTSSPRSEQAVIEAAVEAGIPSLTMMDSFALPADPFHRHQVRADRVTAMSDVVRDNLVAMGLDAERIRVTGCPGFDSHFRAGLDTEAAAFREHHGLAGLSVILWAGGIEESKGTPPQFAGPKLALAVEHQLRAHVRARTDTALIIRYHPSQYHLFGPVQGQPRVYISNPAEEPIELVVKAADTVVVQASTVGFEAALAGKRVLALTYSPAVRFTGLDYAAMGFAEAVPSLADLIPALSRAPARDAAAMHLPPRPAAPAVADLVQQLVQERRGRS